MITNKLPRCILRESTSLRELLLKKWKSISRKEIIKDANNNGVPLTEASLSRYIHCGNVKNALTTSHLMYLCEKYSIEITLKVKSKKKA